MTGRGQPWAIIHGAEERVRDELGASIGTKLDDASIFARSYVRAVRIAGADRVLVAASERQRRLWSGPLAEVSPKNIIIHPYERGIPASILLPFLHIFKQEPSARVLIMPANHIVSEEETFHDSLLEALDSTPGSDNRAVILGAKPTSAAEPGELLIPAHRALGRTREIIRVELTRDLEARTIFGLEGALVDTRMIAAGTSAMLRIYEQALPGLFRSFVTQLRGSEPWTPEMISALYRFLPRAELVRDFIRPGLDLLRVLPVPECGFVHLESLVEAERASPGAMAHDAQQIVLH